ncbi:unnamed protein product [Closterium sp. NIES-53]
MVGSKRFISNARPIQQPTVVTVANNQQLEARACGIVVLKDYSISDSKPRYIDKACLENGVYIMDFDILDCHADSRDLIDLQPQRAVWPHELAHPDGHPRVKHHTHPREIDLHAPRPDGLCRKCHTPTASTTEEKADKGKALVDEKDKAPANEDETSAAGERRRATAEEKGKAKVSEDKEAEAEPSEEAES